MVNFNSKFSIKLNRYYLLQIDLLSSGVIKVNFEDKLDMI